ncbi:DUF1772 domain-containing protein [Kribbella sp. NBC_00709]|uniref:DUF1772 domain-containing protein n=1 Tax=Kribbella sp. NBC_00709 TaxID=2975972 RepID=UPI002E28A1A9|nr:DUF1772 domain-containing protein [Kribbella sp. NBC_00709]
MSAETARSVSRLCCAVLVGIALTVLFLELASRRLDGPSYVAVRQAEFGYFTWFIAVAFVPAVAAVVVLVVVSHRAGSPVFRPALIALGLFVIAGLITAVVNGPINVEQLSWSAQNPPADWARVRDHWQLAHAARTVALVGALACLSLARGDDPQSG